MFFSLFYHAKDRFFFCDKIRKKYFYSCEYGVSRTFLAKLTIDQRRYLTLLTTRIMSSEKEPVTFKLKKTPREHSYSLAISTSVKIKHKLRSFSRSLNFTVTFLTGSSEDVYCYIRNVKSLNLNNLQHTLLSQIEFYFTKTPLDP